MKAIIKDGMETANFSFILSIKTITNKVSIKDGIKTANFRNIVSIKPISEMVNINCLIIKDDLPRIAYIRTIKL